MPYISPSPRQELDVHIEPIVKFIKGMSAERFGYIKFLRFALIGLSRDLLFFYANTNPEVSISERFKQLRGVESGPESHRTYNDISFLYDAIIKLSNAIIEQIKSPEDGEKKLSGLYNYCCTQISFLSLPSLCYSTLNQARSACAIAAMELFNESDSDNELANVLIGVLLNDIEDESYRRLAVDYEKKKIRENGDITSYKKYNPDEF